MKTTRKYILLLAVLIGILLPWQPAFTAHAQSGITVNQNVARLMFPTGIGFEASIHSDSPITEIALLYGTNGRTCLSATARQEPDFKSSRWVMATWVWDFNRTGSLPPGVEIWWQWEIRDQSGAVKTTEKKTILIEDKNRAWKSLKGSGVTVYWFEGNAAFGQMVLDQAERSLDRLEKQAGLPPSGDVRLNIYASADQVRQAALKLPEWAAGVAYPEYGSILLGISSMPDDWSKRSIAHELAHLVTGERIFNCYGNVLPTWLEEGLAVYAEGELPAYRVESVNSALKGGNLPALRSLGAGFAADPQLAELGYSQGGVLVKYLLDTYGPEKMAALLSAVQEGMLVDKALLQVYEVDTTGLDNAWRVSLGYESAVEIVPTSPASEQNQTPIATMALWTPAFGPKKTAAVTAAPVTETSTPAAAAQAVTEAPQTSATPAPAVEPAQTAPAGGFLWALILLVLLVIVLIAYWVIRRKKQQTP